MKQKQYLKSAVLFIILICAFPMILMFSEKEEFSMIENRTLAKFPEISEDTIQDKSCMKGIEMYLSDHFPSRINWVKAKLNIEKAMGHECINDVYITKDKLFEKLAEPDYDEIQLSVDSINRYANTYETKVFSMIVPTSAGIYNDELQPYFSQVDQKKLISDVYKKFNKNVNVIDVYSAIYSVRDKYIYYRTDHHWTSEGAFTAYKAAARKMGISCYDDYNVIDIVDDFKGTFYSKCLYDGVKADIISKYSPVNNVGARSVTLNDGIKEELRDNIYFPEFLETNDKYCYFLGQNRALTFIKTNADSRKKLILIKDSYANSFLPFILQNYSDVAVIDLRYVKTKITDYVNPDEYDHTLFLYNASTFSTDKNIKNIGLTQ